jgi:hypothetical protein
MAEMTQQSVPPAAGEPELTPQEIEVLQRDELFADPGELSADDYPRARNISGAFMFRRVVRALAPVPPEYVTIPLPGHGPGATDLFLAIAKWNMLWEAAQFRRRFFSEDEFPPELREVADRGDVNVVFVPRTAARYYEYAPLFHLLSRAQAERHGLRPMRLAIWPYASPIGPVDRYLPADFGSARPLRTGRSINISPVMFTGSGGSSSPRPLGCSRLPLRWNWLRTERPWRRVPC